MTLLRDLIDLPEQVTRGDFVMELSNGVKQPDSTLKDYVVTPKLVEHFDEALTFINGGMTTGKSRGTYLHGSFGSGKSHFMAVLHLLLQGNLKARSIHDLAGVVTKNNGWLGSKKFLMVPYHMIGATSLESAIFNGYVQHLREVHPDAPTPAVFRSQELVANADGLRKQLGDEKFFATMNSKKGAVGANDGWGDLSAGWSASRYDKAKADGPESSEYRLLSGDLIDAFFPSIRKEGEFVRIDEGLSVITQHAKSLGYDALILFLDEMILWLASKAGDVQFLTSEVPKVSKLVESEKGGRPIPLITFIARQRDLRELIGQNVTGSDSLNFADQLKYWEGRFNTITLEDANLPFIAEKRVLRPKSEGARKQIDEEFERTSHLRTEVMNVLLTSKSDQKSFRRLYPFSPALVETLVAVSSLLQRERTALKIMLQLLVDQKDTLRLGELVPVGDLYDEIAQGDEAFSSDMKRHFDTAHRLYRHQLRPMLEDDHGTTFEEAAKLDYRDPKREALRNDDRLLKTLLLASLAPEVESLKNLTPQRLAALNHGTIKSPIPGQEATIVLNKVRKWAGHLGQIKISEGASQPIISIQLTGVDVDSILAKADTQDNFGNRIRLLKSMMFDQLGISASDDLWIEHKFRWRGTERRCKVFFSNVWQAEDGTLEEAGDEWKLVIDYPIDIENRGPKDDMARLERFRKEHGSAHTLVWLPSFLSSQTQRDIGQLVRLEHILSENRFTEYVRDLSPMDRESARSILTNKRDALRQRLVIYLGVAYGLQNDTGGVLDGMQSLSGEEHFQSLASGLELKVPGETHLGPALKEVLTQALANQYPEHPKFEEDLKLTKGNVQRVLEIVSETLRTKERRLHVEKPDRVIMRQIANTLKLGEMGETHFVIGEKWKDHFHRMAAKGEGLDKIRNTDLSAWIDEPEAMGLPPLLQDLIIMVFAQQTNRAFTLHGGPVEPELGKIHEQCVLKQQTLPSDNEWLKAVELAQTALGISGLPNFLSGQSVLKFSELVKMEVSQNLDLAQKLRIALQERALDFGEAGDFERLQTAKDSVKLLTTVKDRSDTPLIQALAELELNTPGEAIGTSLKKAADIVSRLKTCDLTAINSIAALEGQHGEKGREYRDQLFEAFRRNEYAVSFGQTFDSINHAAIQLLSSLVPKNAVPTPEPAPPAKTNPPAPEAESAISKWGRSQVKGDDVPSWVPAKLKNKLLTVIQAKDLTNAGKLIDVVVTRNLEALLADVSDLEVDLKTGRLRIPSQSIDCQIDSEPGPNT